MSMCKGSEFEGRRGEVVFGKKCEGDSGSYLIDRVLTSGDDGDISNKIWPSASIDNEKSGKNMMLEKSDKRRYSDKMKFFDHAKSSKIFKISEKSSKVRDDINNPKKTISQRISARLSKKQSPTQSPTLSQEQTPSPSSSSSSSCCQDQCTSPSSYEHEYQSTPSTLSPSLSLSPSQSQPHSQCQSQYQSHTNIDDLLILEELTRRESLIDYVPAISSETSDPNFKSCPLPPLESIDSNDEDDNSTKNIPSQINNINANNYNENNDISNNNDDNNDNNNNDDDNGDKIINDSILNDCPILSIESALLEAVEYFIPLPALRAIYSRSLTSIAELRQVTSLFLKLDSYFPEENVDPISLQPFFYLLQQILAETGGFLRQFLVDDKVRSVKCIVVFSFLFYFLSKRRDFSA